MEVSRHWLEQELLPDSFYHGYELDWFLNQHETNVSRLVEKLSKPDVMEKFDNQYDRSGHYSAALAFANWLLIHSMDDRQLLRYVLAAVEQILPLVKRDFPDDKTAQRLMALTKTYVTAIQEMPLNKKLSYRNLFFELIEFSCKNIDTALDAKLSWSIYAAHLAAYTAVYSTFINPHPPNKFPVHCALHTVTFSVCYLANKPERDRLLKKIIEYGLSLIKDNTIRLEPEKALQGVS